MNLFIYESPIDYDPDLFAAVAMIAAPNPRSARKLLPEKWKWSLVSVVTLPGWREPSDSKVIYKNGW